MLDDPEWNCIIFAPFFVILSSFALPIVQFWMSLLESSNHLAAILKFSHPKISHPQSAFSC